MNYVYVGIICFALGGIAATGLFVWLNRNKPDQLDRAEGVVRGFRKP